MTLAPSMAAAILPTSSPLNPPQLPIMNIIAARQYVSPRSRPLTPEEAETRRLSYAIKSPQAAQRDVATVALEMARLITAPCWLIPIPDRNGNTAANTRLAQVIAFYAGNGAEVVKAIIRTRPIESQCERHRKRLGAIPAQQHNFQRTGKFLTARPTYFVDNVTTSGNTFKAAHNAMSFGTGLAFADAFNPKNR